MLIGLDYGTTTSLAISWLEGRPHEEGRILSSVYICNDGKLFTDETAYRNRTSSDGRFVRSPKSKLHNHEQDAQQLVCATLVSLFSNLNLAEKEDVRITLTVPNAWKDQHYVDMRNCVYKAAEQALGHRFDKDNFTIIPEPVAAALHFIVNKRMDGDKDTNYVVVCDIGGGTTDLAVVKCEKYREPDGIDLVFEVACPMDGDPKLGGDNFDEALMKYLLPDGVPAGVPEYVVWNSIKVLKSQLSTQDFAQIPLMKADGTILLDAHRRPKLLKCTRTEFEGLIKEYLNRLTTMLNILANKLQNYDSTCDLSQVYLLPVGGSCRIPAIRETLEKVFKARLCDMVNETEESFDSIASGAAFYSAWLAQKVSGYRAIEITNRLPHRLAIKHGDNALETWVPKNSPDGKYSPKMLHPIHMNPGGETFQIGKIQFFQGDGDFILENRNEHLKCADITIDEPIYAHGRRTEEIPVRLEVIIEQSRIHEVVITVDRGRENGRDFKYSKKIDG